MSSLFTISLTLEKLSREVDIVSNFVIPIFFDLNKILSKNTGQSLKKIEEDTDRDNFMSANEAKKYGLIDLVLSARK